MSPGTVPIWRSLRSKMGLSPSPQTEKLSGAFTMHLCHQIDLSLKRSGAIGRRDFLRGITAASVAAGTLSWQDLVTLEAAELRKQGRACILLWMQGGPSPFETFSPKPGHPNGGETKAIPTSVSGIEVSENF